MTSVTAVTERQGERNPAPRVTMAAPSRWWLWRLENLAALALFLWLYSRQDQGWLFFATFFLAPDLSLAGYLAHSRAGVVVYNIGHSYVLPLGLVLAALIGFYSELIPFALIWCAHISLDRALGFGLHHLPPVPTADSSRPG